MMGPAQYQVQVPLGTLPINLVLIGNSYLGRLAFVKVRPFTSAIFDLERDGHSIRAAFYEDEFHIFGKQADGEEVFRYDVIYDYKHIPVMLEWLQEQKLQQPEAIFG